ncbi:hypothetical protein [Aeromonas hydrophila]|uniref:hypothetical protein n=1 Tax=Aeromonas hydrophila TaxID=644 RepID=UPI00191E3BB8|nr:hypothetical protein [Aeromonas hydrophila]MBL0562682.1 hypothetical protein [Aeromonas hydrophila]
MNYKENQSLPFCFLFSCPGSKELKSNKPCAGATGSNLDKLLDILRTMNPQITTPKTRSDLYINNAWPLVEYKSATGRTEASIIELNQKWNIVRLCDELAHVQKIIAFGNNAQHVVDKIKLCKPHLITAASIHISMTSINTSITHDINNIMIPKGHKNATSKRLEVVASRIIATGCF